MAISTTRVDPIFLHRGYKFQHWRFEPSALANVLVEWFGRNWVYALRSVIESVKPAEFHPEAEARASLRHAWIVAMNERERRRHRQGQKEGQR